MKTRLLILLVVLVSYAAPAQRQTRATGPITTVTIDDKIKQALDGFAGKAFIYAKNLDTGREYALRADEHVRTASTIKLPIMAEAYRQVAAGKVAWTDELILTKAKKVSGSGVLFEFSDDTKIDLRTAVNLMIVVSDNTATNLVLDRIGADSVNEFMDALGLTATRSMRKVFGGGDSRAGLEPQNKVFGLGRSSARDMVKLLEKLERGEVVSKEASAEMIAILKRQQYKDGIGRAVPDFISVASQSGALDRLRSDVGIIYTRRGRIAMAITIDDMRVVAYDQENPGLAMIWKLSQILQEGLGR